MLGSAIALLIRRRADDSNPKVCEDGNMEAQVAAAARNTCRYPEGGPWTPREVPCGQELLSGMYTYVGASASIFLTDCGGISSTRRAV